MKYEGKDAGVIIGSGLARNMYYVTLSYDKANGIEYHRVSWSGLSYNLQEKEERLKRDRGSLCMRGKKNGPAEL